MSTESRIYDWDLYLSYQKDQRTWIGDARRDIFLDRGRPVHVVDAIRKVFGRTPTSNRLHDESFDVPIYNVVDWTSDPADLVEEKEEIRWLHRAIARLASHHREAVEFRLEGKSFREIGEIMGMSAQGAHKCYQAALEQLRKLL